MEIQRHNIFLAVFVLYKDIFNTLECQTSWKLS